MPGMYGRKQFYTSTITYLLLTSSLPSIPCIFYAYSNTPGQIASSSDDDVHRMIPIVDRKICRGLKAKRADGGRLDPDPGDDSTIT